MSELILEVQNLVKHFSVQQTLIDALTRKPTGQVRAVDQVSFTLGKGEVLAFVGESGCGKTTIARTLIGLETPTSGLIKFDGRAIDSGQRIESGDKRIPLKELRQHAQLIFQDPYESLNPRATIYEIVSEPLDVHGIATNPYERSDRVKSALEDAGLRPANDYLLRFPHELSGGQRQRVAIAAAMVLQPSLLIADEPVSMLDVSIRAEILNLLRELRDKRGVSIIVITHDLNTVAYFADRIAVMYLGRIVEHGKTMTVLNNPQHPYTKALLSVAPVPNPRLRRERVILQGETPNAANIPSGCRFHPRCPAVNQKCPSIDPDEIKINDEHFASCILLR